MQTKLWLLADVRICLTKDFEPIECAGKHHRYARSANKKAYPLPQYQLCPANNINYVPKDRDSLSFDSINMIVKDVSKMPVAASTATVVIIPVLIIQVVYNIFKAL